MNIKKYLKKCAEQDRQSILETETSKNFLQRLIKNNLNNQNKGELNAQNKTQANTAKNCICPDCGNTLIFNPTFGRFMHENCEALNCWYAANELGECVDNNEMRAERIAKFGF